MSTPQDGLANVIADVSFNISGAGVLTIPSNADGRSARFQVGPAAALPAVAGVAGVGIVRTATGVVDVAIDAGKGAGPNTVAASLQCEFSVAYNGQDPTLPMSHTVAEKTGATASTPNLRIFTFHFFSHTLAPGPGGSVVVLADPAQCTITVRRKKELYPQ